jgi:hypothetical protein
MMKIYLAGPMRGLPDYNFPEFNKYAALLRSQGHEVFNPAEVRIPQDNIRAIFAVEMDWLCREAEAIYLMPGWSRSRGAYAELALAKALDLKVAYLDYRTILLPENFSQLAQPSSTTSPLLLPPWPELASPDKNSTTRRGGIGLSRPTRQTLLFAITWSGILLTWTVFLILGKWLGGL